MLKNLRQRLQPEPWERTLYILFIVQLLAGVGFSSIFPFLPLYVEDLGSSYGISIELLAGLVFSSQAITMMIASPIWGGIADRYGRKLMVERAQYGGAILITWMGFVNSAEELVLLRAIQGFVSGTVAASNALIASVAPRERSGYAMGLLQTGLGAGIALGPLIGGALADAYGYQVSFYITGALLLIAGILVTFGVQEEFDPEKVKHDRRGGMLKDWKYIVATPGVATTFMMRFLAQFGRMMLIPTLPFFVASLLKDGEGINTYIGLIIGAGSLATTLSAVYLGKLGDRIGHRKILIVSLLAAGVIIYPESLVTAGWQLLALFTLAGVAFGGVIPTISALLARYTQEGGEGTVYGLDNSINAAGRAAAPLVGAWVAAAFGLRATFVATALVLVAASGLAKLLLPKKQIK